MPTIRETIGASGDLADIILREIEEGGEPVTIEKYTNTGPPHVDNPEWHEHATQNAHVRIDSGKEKVVDGEIRIMQRATIRTAFLPELDASNYRVKARGETLDIDAKPVDLHGLGKIHRLTVTLDKPNDANS